MGKAMDRAFRPKPHRILRSSPGGERSDFPKSDGTSRDSLLKWSKIHSTTASKPTGSLIFRFSFATGNGFTRQAQKMLFCQKAVFEAPKRNKGALCDR